MSMVQWLTPEWLEETDRIFQDDTESQEKLKNFTAKLCYHVKAFPKWGIDDGIRFVMFFNDGEMEKIAFMSEEEAEDEADFIVGATPKEWKKLLRKKSKFITAFMMRKIRLEQGSKPRLLKLVPHANDLVDVLTKMELIFPDEMSSDEREEFQSSMIEFREELGV